MMILLLFQPMMAPLDDQQPSRSEKTVTHPLPYH